MEEKDGCIVHDEDSEIHNHNMTSNEISHVIIEDLSARQFPIFLTSFAGQGISEADVFAVNRNGFTYEFEIKRSRSDFFAEFKNKTTKHRLLSERESVHSYNERIKGKKTENIIEVIMIPNRYFFLCEDGLIKRDEVPEYAGLLYVKDGKLTEIKNAPLLHKNKANSKIYERISTILSQRIIYGCSYYNYRQKLKNGQENKHS